MADAINLAASIIAIIQLAAKTTSLSYGYFGAVKDAPTSAQVFMDELSALTKVLTTLEGCALANPGSPVLKELEGPVRKCVDEMQLISKKLDPSKKGWLKKKIARYKWPLKEAETSAYLKRLERHKNFFILVLKADELNRSKAVGNNVEEVMADVKDLKISATSAAQRFAYSRRKEILEWLYPGYFDTKHNNISNRRQKGTGEWLLRRPEFQDWTKKDPNSPLLLGYGIPGAGKTFLSSRVIDHLLSQAPGGSYGVAYIYFDYKERDQQKPAQAVACLIKQLLCQSKSPIPQEVKEQYQIFDRERKTPTLQNLYDILLMVTKLFTQTFIICDALDECDQKTQRRELLPLFHRMGQAGMNLFLTSREYPEDVQASLHGSAKLRLSAQDEDITSYVERKIEENPRAKRLVSQGNCKEKITNGLIECAKGMFLLVHFHIEYLCQQTTVREILKELEDIKNNSNEESPLDPTYDRAMENLRGQSKSCVKLAYKMLTWLVKARKVLTISEIQTAVSVEQDLTALDDFDIADRKTLLEVCASLVTVDEQNDEVRLAHYTVQEYLVKKSIIPADAEFRVAMACTTFLSFDEFAQGACLSNDSFDARRHRHPFLRYAAQNIYHHIRECDEALSVGFVLRFVKSPGCILSYQQASSDRCCSKITDKDRFDNYPKDWGPLHVAAYLGHYTVVQLLLKEIDTMDRRTDTSLTALHEAARQGHLRVAQLLIDSGADVSAIRIYREGYPGKVHETPLASAALNYHEEVVRLLLDKGSKVTGASYKPLLSQLSKESMVRLLFEGGADLDERDHYNEDKPALYSAIDSGSESWVRLLLELGAKPTAQDSGGMSMFNHAVIRGNQSIIKMLLKNGADMSNKDDFGKTPLHCAIILDGQQAAKLLIEEGVDVSARDNAGATALHWAAGIGRESAFLSLIKNGAELTARDDSGAPVLFWAAKGCQEPIIKLMVEMGVDLMTRDNDGSTVLHWAVDDVGFNSERESIVPLLLQLGVDPSIVNKNGQTALQIAESQGYDKVVQILENYAMEHPMRMVEEAEPQLCSL